jgi:hypothetical protein
LVCSIVGTYFADIWGRKPTAIASTASLTVFLFIVGALTKGLFELALPGTHVADQVNTVYGTSSNTSGVYGTVAAIFLFQGAYSFGWTPLLYLYPPEVLNYPIRANGMGVFQFVMLAAIMYYWVETKGKSLEEIDAVLEGEKHSDVPDLEMIYKGKEEVRGSLVVEVNELKD